MPAAGGAQKQAPSIPASKQIAVPSDEFAALKKSLDHIDSWEMSPNKWGDIQIIYSGAGSEKQARAFIKAIELPTPEM
ncbi:MAG: hypothetical protein N3E51_04835 [Candidatus Micrarchaeota archaeon]|nr:hypothetical protein [Candidatus Micrarchaeota archaeon]